MGMRFDGADGGDEELIVVAGLDLANLEHPSGKVEVSKKKKDGGCIRSLVVRGGLKSQCGGSGNRIRDE